MEETKIFTNYVPSYHLLREPKEPSKVTCDCGRIVQRNQLYVFPGTLNGKLDSYGVNFIGGNKKMCRICYTRSWASIRDFKGSVSSTPEIVTHIHEPR